MTVEAVRTLQTQRQSEDEFFTMTRDDDGVIQDIRIPRNKIRQNMSEYVEQLLQKEIQTLYIRRY